MGQGYRMPTVQDCQELIDNTTSVLTTLNGVLGRLLTSNVNGNTIFIPIAGFYNGTTLSRKGQYGLYWTRDYYSSDHAHNLGVTSGALNPNNNDYRNYGFTIRAVKLDPNRSIAPQTSVSERTDEETPTTEEPKDDNQR